MEQREIFVRRMRSITSLGTFAILVGLVGSPHALAQQAKGMPPLGTNVPRELRAPAPAIKLIPANQLPKQLRLVPAPGTVKPGGPSPQPLSPTNRPPADRSNFSGVKHAPSGAVQPTRPRAVHREVARRITAAGGVLVLPVVAFYGAPVILDVPGVGYVEVPEDEYARLYEQLSSSDPDQVDGAIASLRTIKAAEDARVEAARRSPVDGSPSDGAPGAADRDLSEPISFDGPSNRRNTKSPRRLY
jgi:hypothetical protein